MAFFGFVVFLFATFNVDIGANVAKIQVKDLELIRKG
jgi:hypothetical protein